MIQNASIGGTQGFFSPMTRVYIGDVLDHLEIIVSNMDQFVATCDHLTDYVFVSIGSGEADVEYPVVSNERIDREVEYCHGGLSP